VERDHPRVFPRPDILIIRTAKLGGPSATSRPVLLKRHPLQSHSAKQLCVSSYDDGGETHRDCANAHGQIESPADEKASCHRDGDKIIGGRPNQILP
jgi:hypothetical protein